MTSRSRNAPVSTSRTCWTSSEDRPSARRRVANLTTVRSAVSTPASTIDGIRPRICSEDRSDVS